MPVALVLGCCVYHVAHQSMRQALSNVGQNVELPQYTQALYDARELAMTRMQAEATEVHADGVVGARVESSSHGWGEHAVEFLAIGTAGAGLPARDAPAQPDDGAPRPAVTTLAAGASGAPARTRVAARAGQVTAGLSRLLGRGDGTVIGGRVSLWVDPDALARLGADRWVSLVSGTNGKTTTTRLLAAALARGGPVAINPQGSNLLPGLVAGLARSEPGAPAALEVDEAWLGVAAAALHPATFTLLNLTRDQLDRVAEVRRLADRWRTVVAAHPDTHVIANADDPLVAWAAAPAPAVTWVGAGQPWTQDAAGCPACGGRIRWDDGAWACTGCDFARPEPAVWVEGEEVVGRDGSRHRLDLRLPGRANRANAAMAAVTALQAGVGLDEGLAAMAATVTVDGRYRQATVGTSLARLLLAKNPAGWIEVFDMLAPPPGPVVVVINARIADGRDPSWLWDVPFERLAGRPVAASGERSRDLAVRLAYAEVEHLRIPDPIEAIAALGPGAVDVAANYTALRDLDARLRRRSRPWRPWSAAPPSEQDRSPVRRPAGRGPSALGIGDSMTAVTVALVYPDLLGTYGDGGNARVLVQRLRWRGIDAELLTVGLGTPLPRTCDLYVLGGGEDAPQSLAASELRREGALAAAVEAGAALFAVCAGVQVVGGQFLTNDGLRDGAELVDIETRRGLAVRAVGELAVDPDPALGLPRLSGYENHAGATRLGPGVRPLGRVVAGVGNGAGDGTDGFVSGHLLGTYLHGPALARNPELADLLLSWVVGDLPALARPEVDAEAAGLRASRLAAAIPSRRPGRLRGWPVQKRGT